MPMTAEQMQSGECADGQKAVLVTKFRKPDGTTEYNAFCPTCLPEAKTYIDEKIVEAKQ